MTTSESVPVARLGPARTAAGLAGASIVAVGLNAVVATIARSLGASGDFQPLQLRSFAVFTVAGVLIGAAGWVIIRARSADPARLLRILVPAVLILSLIPDVAVAVGGTMAGVSWGAAAALMIMHLVVGTVAVATYSRVLPLRR